MRFLKVLIAATTMIAMPALAANDPPTAYTRAAETGTPRPSASITELAWLIGRWEGPGIAGAMAQETWSAPLGGIMAGTFVQADSKGGVMFSEVMQIAPDGDSLIVRLKHFNADLTGWEEKDKSVNFPLIAREGNSWYFNGLTYRREGRNRLLVAVRMRGDDGKVSELVFRFRRVGS
jgi:hypothetical protein